MKVTPSLQTPLSRVTDKLSQTLQTQGSLADQARQLQHLHTLNQRVSPALLEQLQANLDALFGGRHDVMAVMETLLEISLTAGLERPEALRQLDAQRVKEPHWFGSHKKIGAAMYVDRHCGTLSGLKQELAALLAMGITVLHLMPTVYKTPAQNNDGGYAISDFRSLNPAIGTMDELFELFASMREKGISPMMDVTINHVADEHPWAQAAQSKDPDKLKYFFAFTEAEKNDHERHLNQVFPNIRPGNFTWNEPTGRYIWTTFMSSQWDLNYTHPPALAAMIGVLAFLLNRGVEVLRLDAVPFIWKEKGTDCLDRPEVQNMLGVFNTFTKIAAPGAVLLSEAIREPQLAQRNLGPDKCQMIYNTVMLAHPLDALAFGDPSFMAEALRRYANVPPGTTQLNMVRTHDQVIFCFDPASAHAKGIDLPARYQALREFYLGGQSYAAALPFSPKDSTGPLEITGTLGSLMGIEKALRDNDPVLADAAMQRIKLLNALALSLPGVPMLNLMGGDDRGQINDPSFAQDPVLRQDNRWANRVRRDPNAPKRHTLEARVMRQVSADTTLLNLTRAQDMPAFGAGTLEVIDVHAPAVLAFTRASEQQKVVVLANFSSEAQTVEATSLRAHGMESPLVDKIGPAERRPQPAGADIQLAPYQCMWLVPAVVPAVVPENASQ